MKTPETTQALIFDVEGTLIDCIPQTLESWRLTLCDDGHELTTSDLQPYSGMDGRDMLKELLPKLSTARVQRLLKAQGERYRQDFIQTTRAFDGVREIFARLKRAGFSIAIATTCQRDELTVYNTFMHTLDFADAVVCGNDVKHGKPHPDLLQSALWKLKCPESSCALAVGDTPYDAKAASAVGMGSVGVLSGGFSRAALQSSGCDTVLHALSELVPYLQSSSPRHSAPLSA